MSNLAVRPRGELRVSDPGLMYLGMLQPDPADVEAVAEEFRYRLRESTAHHDKIARELKYQESYPLPLHLFSRYVVQQRQLAKELRTGAIVSVEDTAALRGLVLRWRPEYTPDFAGWTVYLKDMLQPFRTGWHKFERRSALPEETRQEHTLIVGSPKWGKSELMKSLAFHYATTKTAAVVMLDPHSHMVQQIARWPELVRSNRAILVQPGLRDRQVLSFNPLAVKGLSEADRLEVASFWATQFGALTSDLTMTMRRMALHCMLVLLSFEGATFLDLLALLNIRPNKMTPRQRELYTFATKYPDDLTSGFFRNDFLTSFFESSRNGLKGRIETVLMMPNAKEMLCVTGDFSLEQEIEDRKFILVDLGAFGREGGYAVGKLLIAMIGAIARKRKGPLDQYTPTHLFVDEAPNLVSDEMLANLKELRKFGLYSTLAMQIAGDGFEPKKRAQLYSLTGCKFVGSEYGDIDLLQTKEKLPPIKKRQFYVKWSDDLDQIECLTVRPELANYEHSVPKDEWRAYVDTLVSRYYRGTDTLKLSIAKQEFYEEPGVGLYPSEKAPDSDDDAADDIITAVMSKRVPPPTTQRLARKRQSGRRRNKPHATPPA